MPKARKWTLETVKKEAAKYPTRTAFKRGNQSAYITAWRRGWLDSLGLPSVKLKWTYEKVKAEATRFRTRSAFYAGSSSAYAAARKNGWLNELYPTGTPIVAVQE